MVKEEALRGIDEHPSHLQPGTSKEMKAVQNLQLLDGSSEP
jgi:hypothetical protein